MRTAIKLTLLALAALALTTLSSWAARDDGDRIVSAAKDSYARRTQLEDDHTRIEAKNGIAMLTGEAARLSHQTMAQDAVENLPGVKNVNNQLVMQPANERSDVLIVFQVKSALLCHRSVMGTKADVSVKDGVATLKGEVENQAEKDLATNITRDIKGVNSVVNGMEVTTEGRWPCNGSRV